MTRPAEQYTPRSGIIPPGEEQAVERCVLQRQAIKREAISLAVFCGAFYLAYRYGMSFSQASASPFWYLLLDFRFRSPRARA